jgi:hypothetical protein
MSWMLFSRACLSRKRRTTLTMVTFAFFNAESSEICKFGARAPSQIVANSNYIIGNIITAAWRAQGTRQLKVGVFVRLTM